MKRYENKEIGITKEEKILLEDIYSNKLSGVVERYKRLNVSRRKGNEMKNSLLKETTNRYRRNTNKKWKSNSTQTNQTWERTIRN